MWAHKSGSVRGPREQLLGPTRPGHCVAKSLGGHVAKRTVWSSIVIVPAETGSQGTG